MRIHNIHISNFRKLKKCRVDFDEKQTIFIGANNSGKTSAITAITWFLCQRQNCFSTREFTLTNWKYIDAIGEKWVEHIKDETKEPCQVAIDEWNELLPTLDLWLEVDESELYIVSHLIPSLDWKDSLLGVRIRFEPKEITELYQNYLDFYKNIQTIKNTEEGKQNEDLDIYKDTLWEYLNRQSKIKKEFEFKYYILNSENIREDSIQATPQTSYDGNPLDGLLRIDTIEAYRRFSDVEGRETENKGLLSEQLQNFYQTVLAPETGILSEGDIQILSAIQNAGKSLDETLKSKFSPRIDELKGLNYPGFQNPEIEVHSKIDPAKAISHESAVRYKIDNNSALTLPEQYNGLGYQNLLSIYFKLMQFRNAWILGNDKDDKTESIPPIHLVFIEEPEAHLHVQAQQVFIRKAYETLRNDDILKDNKYTTQLVVSTHSTHILHEVDFGCLRYFKRECDAEDKLPITNIINLTNTFGENKENEKFVTRYIHLNDCDIFFADAAILVEGAAERIMMPSFIEDCKLSHYYIAIMEINGAHAHRMKPLIEKLQIPCLIITDLDAQKTDINEEGKTKLTPVLPQKNKGQTTNNDTLKKWIPQKSSIDELLDLSNEEKNTNNIRIAYQAGIKGLKGDTLLYPYTFEDALAFTNTSVFKEKENKGLGLISKLYNLFNSGESIEKIHEEIFKSLKDSSVKARFATDLVCLDEFKSIKTPEYIKEGLEWIKSTLSH